VQFALDRTIVVVPVLLLAILVTETLIPKTSLHALAIFVVVLLCVVFVLIIGGLWLVETWWPRRHGGQTPAMRWLGLRIVTVDGGEPTMAAYLVRAFLLVVDGFLFGLVGLVVMAGNPQHQRVGDMVAGT